jgi:F-type H+-transporting ATPase subunit delta
MITDRTLAKKASQVYAEVLLEAVSASSNAFEVGGQLETVYKTVAGTVELRDVLTDHAIEVSVRQGVIRDLFADFDPALLSVLDVMIERGDVRLLNRINEAYAFLAEQELNAVFIDVTTAVELDDALRSSIRKKYSAQFGKDVLLREYVDPSLVGGIVLSAHGRRIDASVASQLESARRVLSTIPSGGDR